MGEVKRDSWEEAIDLLSPEDKEIVVAVQTKTPDRRAAIEAVLETAKQTRDECLSRRWKIVRKGKTIILRDVLEKVTVWINRFKGVGDALVQYDPGHATIPWAIIRLFLQVTVTDVEIFGIILNSIELVSKLLARCAILEHLYLGLTLEVSKSFREALVALYVEILKLLVKIQHYYDRSTISRAARGAIFGVGDVESWYQTLHTKESELDKLVQVADSEKLKQISETVKDVSAGQQEQDKKLEQREKVLLRMLQELEQPINRLDRRLAEIQDNLEINARIGILKSISPIPYASHHKSVRKDRLNGSGQWLLAKQEYQEWRSDSSPSVIWLHGIPGSGKTKIASLVIDDVQGTTKVAYFYCVKNSAEPERAQCEAILASLVRQLTCATPNGPILDPVRLQYEEETADFEGNSWTIEESTDLLIKLSSLYPSVIFILDALDEVDILDRPELLTALTAIMQQSSGLVKIFISSRDSIDIVLRLKEFPNIYINAHDNKSDIITFINQRLEASKLLHGKLSSKLRDKITSTLITGAQGMFRWVDLQLQSLRRLKVAGDIEARLGQLPETLEESYWEIYQEIEASGENAAQLARMCFQWLLCAQEPLSLADFAHLASVAVGHHDSTYSVPEVLDVCSNLIVSDDPDSFRFAHLSVREFLEALTKRGIESFQAENANATIASTCLSLLSSIYEPSGSKALGSASSELPSALNSYLVKYWPHHVSQSEKAKIASPLKSQVKDFLIREDEVAPTFIKWCEQAKDCEEFGDLVQPPYNPIWISEKYQLIERSSIIVSDIRLQRLTLTLAAKRHSHEVINWLFEQRVNFKELGKQAVIAAIENKHADTVQLLLDNGAPAERHCLFLAAMIGDKTTLGTLLKERASCFTVADLTKALTTAASNGDPDMVNQFLELGATREVVAVARAVRNGVLGAASNLIDQKFDITAPCFFERRTPLHWAADRGYVDIARKLLEKGVPTDVQDVGGKTPLQLALLKNHSTTVMLLQSHGIRDLEGGMWDTCKAYHAVEKKVEEEMVEEVGGVEEVEGQRKEQGVNRIKEVKEELGEKGEKGKGSEGGEEEEKKEKREIHGEKGADATIFLDIMHSCPPRLVIIEPD
ncbi:hypothetical protein AJ80_04266 [Polytolypa hystricis UAMH7299]|uniref:Uncharacterized protein n=1 Tax=Polytolypa hystricis (strain UAMH7299) TaxID=1447883 RepID=A0A2B7YCX6_POLH7|nr:hypothetical protein AJ80_04266 [Polytolypa hystricis UAMH7299]